MNFAFRHVTGYSGITRQGGARSNKEITVVNGAGTDREVGLDWCVRRNNKELVLSVCWWSLRNVVDKRNDLCPIGVLMRE